MFVLTCVFRCMIRKMKHPLYREGGKTVKAALVNYPVFGPSFTFETSAQL